MGTKDWKDYKQHKIPAGYKVLVDTGDIVRMGKILASPDRLLRGRRLSGGPIVNWKPLKARVSGVVRVGDGIIWVITKE